VAFFIKTSFQNWNKSKQSDGFIFICSSRHAEHGPFTPYIEETPEETYEPDALLHFFQRASSRNERGRDAFRQANRGLLVPLGPFPL
jgi:hypothetical protein